MEKRPLLILNVKVLVGAFNQVRALVGACFVIVKLQTYFAMVRFLFPALVACSRVKQFVWLYLPL